MYLNLWYNVNESKNSWTLKEGVIVAKKKTKREKKKAFAYSTELYGVLLLLAGIIGIGKYGPVGNLISAFAVFLVGVFYNILLIF